MVRVLNHPGLAEGSRRRVTSGRMNRETMKIRGRDFHRTELDEDFKERKEKTKPVKRVRAFFARDTTASRYALVDRTKNAKPIYITSSDDRRPFRATPSRIYYYVIRACTRLHPRFYSYF